MRLYAVAYSAMRNKDGDAPEINIHCLVALSVDDSGDEDAQINAHAAEHFPESDGWTDHQAVFSEVKDDMMIGPYRLTWQVTHDK